jgi:hypothetical protein
MSDEPHWRHLPSGTVLHAVKKISTTGLGWASVCGRWPYMDGYWLTERAANMSRCRNCESILKGAGR